VDFQTTPRDCCDTSREAWYSQTYFESKFKFPSSFYIYILFFSPEKGNNRTIFFFFSTLKYVFMDFSGTDFLSRAASAARDVAREAGALLLGGIDAPRAVDDKGTNDVVTDMDRAADELIIGRLRKLFPLCGMLTEESGNVATAGDAAGGDATAAAGAAGSEDPEDESRYTWVIDPLDGTTSYLHRHPCYSVSIALYDAARGFVVGAVHAPAMDELFLAVRGRGAYLNDRRIHVSATDTLDRALVASGFPYDRRTVEDNNIASFSNVILKGASDPGGVLWMWMWL
jgi:fructose-1,6-bisphosphatase/inositol monophosphatase family enzyme